MLYAIPNVSSHTVFPTLPWEFEPQIPAEALESKSQFTAWYQKPSTKHCHFSAAEGMDPLRRVAGDNPAVLLHGVVGDYDAPCSVDLIKNTIVNSPTEFAPNFGSQTFSGNGRLVWLFETPVSLPNQDVASTFLKIVMKRMKMSSYLPGLDVEAFVDPCRYYERGRLWHALSSDPIPTNMVWQWMYEAGSKRKWTSASDIIIPMEKVAEAIQAKYPGKWHGPFAEGVRGPRFWDDMAVNTTAAVVRATGMQCFSGEQGFVPWSELLGHAFVEKYKADTLGAIASKFHFVGAGNHYWTVNEFGSWTAKSVELVRRTLRCGYGLSSTGAKGSPSDVDKALHVIETQKEVTAALPFIHMPPGLRIVNGERFLNISNAKCLPPSDEPCNGWGDGFPWIAEYLDGFFEPAFQLQHLLGWWQHFYKNGLRQKPRTGHALFIAGPTNVGKTLLSTGLISRTVGGHAKGSGYLLGTEKYTHGIVSQPLMAVDDTQGASDARKHAQYSAAIKEAVANRDMEYSRKFHDTGKVEWLGRIIVTLNLDPEALKMLPNCEMSLMDKIMLLRCSNRRPEFPDADAMEEILSRELPRFCRWLVDWKLPAELKGDARFGVREHHDKHLYNAAIQASASYAFFELLADFLGQLETSEEYYIGTATQLIADMSLDERIGSLAAKYTPNQAASLLGQLKSRGFEFEQVRSSSQRIWKIPLNMMERLEKMNNAES